MALSEEALRSECSHRGEEESNDCDGDHGWEWRVLGDDELEVSELQAKDLLLWEKLLRYCYLLLLPAAAATATAASTAATATPLGSSRHYRQTTDDVLRTTILG